MKKPDLMPRWLFSAALLLLSGLSFIQAQYDDKMFLFGDNLRNYSITERCCGEEGYVVAGTHLSPGYQSHDIVVTAMDNVGNPAWSVIIDNDQFERVFHIEAVADGYALTGFVRGTPPAVSRTFFILLDNNGVVTQSKFYNDVARPNWSMRGMHVLEVSSGDGYLLTGYLSEGGFQLTIPKLIKVMRLDQSGNVLWSQVYDTPDDRNSDFDMGAFALETDDGFYVTGSVNMDKGGNTNQGVLSMMIDHGGNLMWDNNFAIEPGSDIETQADLGTSALFDESENVIVVSANSTLGNNNFYITKIDPSSGSIVDQRAYDCSEEATPSYYIGQNEDGNYIVAGMIEYTPTRFDCAGDPEVYSTVPYIVEVTQDLNTVIASQKFLTHAPTFSGDDGSVYASHFGGPMNLHRPVIATPEMAYTHPFENKTVILGYREDGPQGKYDLQFISNSSPSYDWCLTDEFGVDPYNPQVLEASAVSEDPQDVDVDKGKDAIEQEVATLECSNSFPSGSGSFPIVQTSNSGSSVLGQAIGEQGLVVHNGYSYVAGQFNSSMNNPGLSSSSTNNRPWLAKYDPNGNLVWGKKGDGTTGYNNYASSVEVDDQGDVYLGGFFTTGTLKFDGDPYPAMTSGETVENGGWSSYIIKYDGAGNFQWRAMMLKDVNVFGAAILLGDIEMGDDGYLYVTGLTLHDVDFVNNNSPDPFNGGSTYTTTPAHIGHAYIAKYDPANGQLVYFESEPSTISGTMANFFPRAIEVAPSATNIYLGGENLAGSSSNFEPYIVKANSSGIALSSVQGTSSDDALILTMELDGSSLYVGGTAIDDITFPSGCVSSGLSNDGWFAKFNTSLGCVSSSPPIKLLSDNSGGYLSGSVTGISVSNNDVYVYGSAGGTSISLSGGGSLSTIGSKDLVVAKYNSSLSSAAWETNFGGASTTANSRAIVEDDINCGSFISGSFSGGSLDLGVSSGIISAPTGNSDHFIARVDDAGATYKTNPGTSSTTTAGSLEAGDFTIYPNPAGSVFYVDGLSAGEEVSLWDSSGNLIRQYTATSARLEIERGELATGLYLIRVNGEFQQNAKRIMLR